MRSQKMQEIKNTFRIPQLTATVVHWDGKLLKSATGLEMVDRLTVIISLGSNAQILKVPFLESGIGKMQADAIHDVLCKWGLANVINCCCYQHQQKERHSRFSWEGTERKVTVFGSSASCFWNFDKSRNWDENSGNVRTRWKLF